ncbi:ATP-binding protein [Steroidobacter sp.]|uniref:ATP-binding protein n=1 Tax=Steroidobacter sp. TaxID=1978227 RepID=UPI001A58FC26|nr:ATP-binding protein [Steroidobacter sp.]MBL8269442.1 PAS domain S-box protein [Steroidobacter sp.]
MNASSLQRLPFRNSDIVAMLLIALGLIVAGGWLLGRPMTLTVGLDNVGMTLNAAISFIIAGLALSFGRPPLRLIFAGLLGLVGVLTLCEHLFEVDLHIDRLFGDSWILQAAPHQGRMAPQVAAAFALAALALMLLARPSTSRLHWLPPVATAAVFLIAIISFFGRLLRLDIIYDWHYATRIAPHTAAGLLLLALGLAQLSYRRSFSKADDVSNDSRRILAVSTAAILAITITCAALCFAVLVRHSHDLQQAALGRELRNQVELLGSEIANQRHESERVVHSQSLAQIMARRYPATSTLTLREELRDWADNRLPLSRGIQAVDLLDANGKSLLQSGSFGPPTTSVVHLDGDTRIEIGNDAHIVIERALPPDAAGRQGVMKLQFALPRLSAALLTDASNHDFDTSICLALSKHSMQCLRLSSSPLATLPMPRDAAGRAGAMNLAFSGKTGVTLGAEPDGARFFAAYGPIAGTPLVMTLTTPLDVLYADLRQRLNALLLVMVGLVAAAAWILRWQIAPLIAKVVAARSRANDSAMHLTAIMDTASDGIITLNRLGTVLSANPACRRLLASNSRELIGDKLTQLLPGLELRPDDHGLRSLAYCADQPAMEFLREVANGESLHLQVEFAWLDKATRSTLVATVHDLTLLKRGEMQLRETHERLQDSERLYRDQATRLATLFDSVEDAIVVINAGGNIEAWNRGAQHLFGYTAEDIVGKDARLLLPEPHASVLSRYIVTGERLQSGRIEMEARHGSGRIVPIEVSVREMIINDQRLHVAVMHDISVRREVERMKSEFVSTISHELRTPLTSIAGSLTLISGGAAGEAPPKIARLVGIARQNSERLIRLINDILDLEKAEAGKLDFALNVRSLRSEVAAVAEFNRGFAQGLGVAIELDDGDDADVLIDSDRLTQVLTNLISNAAKFSPPGGVVRIRINRETLGVRVTVTDNGPGIPAEFCERIFQKFAQADASDSRAKGGTGLGLSIAKTITEKMGGRIGFDTVPGQGTSFYIVLPIHGHNVVDTHSKGLHEDPVVEVERSAVTRGEALPQILHVEDDQSLTAIVREALSPNAAVTSARSLAAARQQLAEKHFDALILDVSLPDGSGLDLLPLKQHPGQQRTIIISYTADEPSRSLRNIVDATLVKSRHSVSQLMVTVAAHIEGSDGRNSKAVRANSHP